MNGVAERNIVLGVTGGIAAYKSAELVRLLVGAGARVRVVMTRAAQAFIGPLTLQALSGERVRTDLLDAEAEQAMGHIELARWADLLLIAPASADCLADLAQGRADDLLNTICLATEVPLAVAPAMNRVMWAHPATQENVRVLAERGVAILGPDQGDQACGETGAGRMREPNELLAGLADLLVPGVLTGHHVLITAGPTREPLDPVRYLSNYSSGRMGFATAAAAARAGARVTLVSGPVDLTTPAGVERINVESAREMLAAVEAHADDADVFIGTAAVADYRPRDTASDKLRKSEVADDDAGRIDLVRNPDILASVAARNKPPYTVGFAAETRDVADYAKQKRLAKDIDMICANLVGNGQGFGDVESRLQVFHADSEHMLGPAPKPLLARELIQLIAQQNLPRKVAIGVVK